MRDTTILIRFDDICPTMNWSEWKRAITILDRYNVKPLIGVIPQCQDNELMIDEARNDFWNYIKELQCKVIRLRCTDFSINMIQIHMAL